MIKPSRLFGSRKYLVLILILVSIVLSLTVALAAAAAPGSAPASSGLSLPSNGLTPRSYLPLVVNAYPPLPVWTEVARSPGLSNGWQALGRWRRVGEAQGGDAYPGCIGATDPRCVYHPYEPTTGSNASWWTVGYDDSTWSAQGYVDWNSDWTRYGWAPIPTIGEHVWKAEPGWPAGVTDLHRRTFEIAQGCTVVNARGALFSDNTSRWYINGTFVGQSEATASRLVSILAAPFHSGSNLLAVQVSNDHVTPINNPFGIQYILEVQLLCGPTPPVLTTTATGSATVGQAIHDTAHLSGGTAPLTGTVTFNVYRPSDTTCSTPIAVPPAIPANGAGNYQSGDFTPTLAGPYRWIATYSGDANNQALTTQCNDPNETTIVTSTLTLPILTTTATGATPLGQAIRDVAYLSGGSAPLTGTLTFVVYGPDDATCSAPIAVPPAIPVSSAGNYQSGNYTPTAAGAYRWIAHYSGNDNYVAVSTACNDLDETSTVFTLTLTTNASPVPSGQTIFDIAHLRGSHGTPSGTLTFDVFAPSDTSCATPIPVPPAVTVNGAGDYASGNYTPTLTGVYRWIAHYSGDGINPALSTACADPAEISNVQPGLTLAKSASPTTFTAVGQVVTYTYSITNSGNVTLNGPITVVDDRATTVTCPAVSTFAPGASITCSATYVVTQADMNAGAVTNHAVAHAIFGGEPVTSNQAQATVYAASIALAKSASPTIYHSAGEVITYTYIVTNTGHATLNGPVMVNDDRLGTFACGPAADLIPGASVTCTRTYVIRPADLGNVMHLPIQQLTTTTYGTWLGGVNSTMDVILSGNAPGSDVPNGTFAGWCIEELINGSLYDQLATLYTSTHLNLPSDVVSLPWGKVNYILNHKIRGAGKTDSEFFKDVQTAIWVVLGEPIPTWGISFDAQQMIDAANARPGYVPGLTDIVAVIVYSDGINSTGSDGIQEVIIEAKLGQITNHAMVTATVSGVTVNSNQPEVTIQFVPVYNAVTIKIQKPTAVKSKF